MANRAPIILQNPDHSPLSEKQIRAFAPVIFNDEPRKGMSESYIPVRSWDICQELETLGYVPTHIQLRHRKNGMHTTAHTIRFSQLGAASKLVVRGDAVPQMLMRGSLDGSCKLEFWSALMRLVCSNGLIVSDASIAQPLAVRHLAKPTLAAFHAIEEIAAQSKLLFDNIDAMRKVNLTDKQQLRMANGALAIMQTKGLIQASDLLMPRRPDDAGSDVWRTFNRIQENVVKGGINGKTSNARPTRTRGLTGISAQLDANVALWSLAMDAIGKASESSKASLRALERARASEVLDPVQ